MVVSETGALCFLSPVGIITVVVVESDIVGCGICTELVAGHHLVVVGYFFPRYIPLI